MAAAFPFHGHDPGDKSNFKATLPVVCTTAKSLRIKCSTTDFGRVESKVEDVYQLLVHMQMENQRVQLQTARSFAQQQVDSVIIKGMVDVNSVRIQAIEGKLDIYSIGVPIFTLSGEPYVMQLLKGQLKLINGFWQDIVEDPSGTIPDFQ